jgi:acyl carrier protein
LCKWQLDGSLDFLGRLDHQVKIRGFRIEPGEIEKVLLSHAEIKEVVVTVREEKAGAEARGPNVLCAYMVAGREFGITELRDYLSHKLPDYMVPAYFVQLEKLPLTPAAKIDRKALPEPGLSVAKEYIAPQNDGEMKLTGIWSEVLRIEKDVISIDANFFELGGHSLKATILVSKIHEEFDVKVPLAEVFKTPTVRGLFEYIEGTRKERYCSVEPVEKKEYYPLSSAQKRLYILQQMEWESVSYNMPQAIPLPGGIDKQKLERTFKKLVARHESLRTSFHMIDHRPVQRIFEEIDDSACNPNGWFMPAEIF